MLEIGTLCAMVALSFQPKSARTGHLVTHIPSNFILEGAPRIQINAPAIYPHALPPKITPSSSP